MRYGGSFGRFGRRGWLAGDGREAAAAAVHRIAAEVAVERPDRIGRPPARIDRFLFGRLHRFRETFSASLVRFFKVSRLAVQLSDVLRQRRRRPVVCVDRRKMRTLF